MDHLKLTVDALSVDAISELVVDNSCGAVSIFVGTTRDNFEGKKVVRLEYEAYEPMALKAMKSICEEVRRQWPAVHGIAIYHRLGNVPCREASVVIAVSSPHRRDSLEAVSSCIDRLKASVPIWKKEVYDGAAPAWKENAECPNRSTTPPAPPEPIDKNLVQITVSSEELERRIQNFIERKREQVNISNIHDFMPQGTEGDEGESCARVRAQFVKRKDSKGHLKVHRVNHAWGPQTVPLQSVSNPPTEDTLPAGIGERVRACEGFVSAGARGQGGAGARGQGGAGARGQGGAGARVPPDVYARLKLLEERIAELQAVSPEYALFWKNKTQEEIKQETTDYQFSADDIARKIEQLERQSTATPSQY